MDTGTKKPISANPGAGNGSEPPCWSRIGIDGDSSCPELVQAVHCRNCPVYAEAGRSLLDRPVMSDYGSEWAQRLASEAGIHKRATHAVVIFTLQSEYFALPASIFNEVAVTRKIRRIPGVHNKLLLGMVNIRGELQLCVSLRSLLGFESVSARPDAGRLALIQQASDAWAFPVDEVLGTYRYNPEDLSPPPATVEKARFRFSRGTMDWEGKRVGCLDEVALFNALKGSME